MSHGCTHADRREHHHVVGEFKHDLRKTLHGTNHWLSLFTHSRHGHGEENRERYNLQNIAAHHRVDYAGRKCVHNRFHQRFGMTLADCVNDAGIAGREDHANPRFGQVDHRQPDEERGCRNDLEINKCLETHPSNFSQRASARDSDDNG